MEAAHDAWPAPSGAQKNLGPLSKLGELIKVDPERVSVINIYAYQQISFITPADLWNALDGKEQIFFVDCQDNKIAKWMFNGAIKWDINDNDDYKNEEFFLRRKGYSGGDNLFPTDPRRLPDAVIFNCEVGVNRSPMMAFWYMRYLLKTYPSVVPDSQNVRGLKTRVYILQGGIAGLEKPGTPKGLQSSLCKPSTESQAGGSGRSFASPPQPTNQNNTRHVTSGVNRPN
ncbi:uncharacterized protein FPRO_02021 [Fusarium proliferatum ET1]|uniref:Rhodanese domain-containing protein n=1 Tax=Fusarium proliferatum (strain ET1) TaxID=1227346 RepID=A0A1L7UYP1_FUSPR|nr:uncharacterized protein FPRO_02021 [Fusarium proliferatum ET1]CZR32397.1 uncharacterized protein FPRO_02021 [Fusarium proliferatum ET1]